MVRLVALPFATAAACDLVVTIVGRKKMAALSRDGSLL